jgi:hypothetical protein
MKAFRVRYFDLLNRTPGRFVTIKARSISDATIIAEQRAWRRVGYVVFSVRDTQPMEDGL